MRNRRNWLRRCRQAAADVDRVLTVTNLTPSAFPGKGFPTFGSGLAGEIYATALAEPHPRPEFAWVLSSNERSLRFFGRRGWDADENAGQPDWAGGQHYVKLMLPGAN